ncbi:IclR family transcriptional regulator [Halioxenophilus sp. WMMB6]|uniref:IclR family transcriptional regulator n=1 Tax=Halioxenophilus sp. WMMB6 TaxID=3073815 RepID=UPI00295E2CEA|nr:IclR family transcriptional regulator [Halioxenophilus sp. WMMB6]
MLVKQITNLFSLMELFIQSQRPLSVREIVSELGWPRSSVFNIVSTLVELGYLYQPVARGGYFPTYKWMELARDLSEAQPLPDTVHQLLEDLADETGETAFLAAGEGSNIVFLDVVESAAEIRFIANIGQRLPIHITAAGRAILSQMPEQERGGLLKRIRYQPYEKETFLSPESVEEDIASNSIKGWYSNLGNYAPGVAGVAVAFPFMNRRNAIALGGPVSRIEDKLESLGSLLTKRVGEFLKQHNRKSKR